MVDLFRIQLPHKVLIFFTQILGFSIPCFSMIGYCKLAINLQCSCKSIANSLESLCLRVFSSKPAGNACVTNAICPVLASELSQKNLNLTPIQPGQICCNSLNGAPSAPFFS